MGNRLASVVLVLEYNVEFPFLLVYEVCVYVNGIVYLVWLAYDWLCVIPTYNGFGLGLGVRLANHHLTSIHPRQIVPIGNIPTLEGKLELLCLNNYRVVWWIFHPVYPVVYANVAILLLANHE